MGLDERAMDAVKTWKFEPGRREGMVVAVQVDVEVNFRLY
jgi:TonB family protein